MGESVNSNPLGSTWAGHVVPNPSTAYRHVHRCFGANICNKPTKPLVALRHAEYWRSTRARLSSTKRTHRRETTG